MTSPIPTHHYTDVNGLCIRYIEKPGDSTDQTILFVHGRALSLESWEKQFSDPIFTSYRLIALDLPGHGLSDRSDDLNQTYSLDGFKNLLISFIDQLSISDYILAGLSLGGHIAIQALPFLTGCKGVFAMTMPITKPMQPALMYRNGEILAKAYTSAPLSDDVNNYLPILFNKSETNIATAIINGFHQTDPRIHDGIVHGVIAGAYEDETAIINNTSIPVAILAGTEDQIHDLAYLDELKLRMWRNEYQKIANAGHMLNWENPDQTNQLLKAFAEDCFGDTASKSP